jgi:hypothetical protein
MRFPRSWALGLWVGEMGESVSVYKCLKCKCLIFFVYLSQKSKAIHEIL